jgi:ABC-type sugar transport system ATPase subunit
VSADLALQLVGIDKRFGGVHALRGASLDVRRGEIMGVCGENGAGKSTLLMLGREPGRFGIVDDAKLEALARADLARFGFADDIDVTAPVMTLGIGMQQVVEIVRALPQDARVLVLDEPTAALTTRETAMLTRWLESLRAKGTTCVYVSHKLDEVFAICDRVTVLRDGKTATVLDVRATTAHEVVVAMVGRAVDSRPRARGRSAARAPSSADAKPLVLEVRDLHVNRVKSSGLAGARAQAERTSRPFVLSGVTLSVSAGEIVAVSGAMGSGRTALLSSLFGCARAGMSGSVFVGGVAATLRSPINAIRLGVAFLPEDRKGAGIVPEMTVGQNLALASLSSRDVMGEWARVGWVDSVAESRLAAKQIRSLRVHGEASALVVTLSGGNQQKVVLGKWLERRPKLLLLDEPTRGVDIGAREEIYAILEDLAASGVAILFASSDLTEVRRLADRVLVLREGRITGELDGAEATEEAIAALITGASESVRALSQVGT